MSSPKLAPVRRWWAVGLLAGLLLSPLPGWGQNPQPATSPPVTATAPAVDAPAADGRSPSDTESASPPRTSEARVADTEPASPAHRSEAGVGDTESEPAGLSRREVLMASLTIFVLAIFVGFEVITKVPPTLHTPLMSGSNAISGITIVGAIVVAGYQGGFFLSLVALLAVAFAMINVVGGFLVTHRMLAMFKRR